MSLPNEKRHPCGWHSQSRLRETEELTFLAIFTEVYAEPAASQQISALIIPPVRVASLEQYWFEKYGGYKNSAMTGA
jgi:hypothetical protein